MTTNETWQDLYRAALLELCPEELRRRIDLAEEAVQRRIVELRQSDSDCADERHALDDALRGLRILVNTECTPLEPPSGLAQNGTAS